ncbi:MAG TPA: tRNA 2-thiouridine(34) synthase MnmA [Phycisphaerales bacterium]|nr:tRNA 2-thiouridine(34) synthase MnmA [Phycisphaerales bacterium]
MMAGKWNIKLLPPSLSPWAPRKASSKQIAVLMSGGVDSSVAAYLLKQDRWDVFGITMKIPVSCSTGRRGCCGADAAFICNELGLSHYFIDVTEAFQKLIIEPFRKSYGTGETPNPCVDCNTLLKFSLVWDFLKETFGIAYLATGHYAKVSKTNSQVQLGLARDKAKDQSYFLYGIARGKLERLALPLGALTKERVRSIAAQLNLSVADKAESMELCFAGENDYRAALTDAEANQAGEITNMQGNKIGTHRGIANYTLGQRRGIGFAGGKPLYVGKINAQTNTITLTTREEISSHTVRANQINTLIPQELASGKRMYGKIRSYGDPQPCKLIDVNKTAITVEFDQPQFAPCPGQRLVLYNSANNIIAGGTISRETALEKIIS